VVLDYDITSKWNVLTVYRECDWQPCPVCATHKASPTHLVHSFLGFTMTVSLPGSKKRGLAGLLGRKDVRSTKPAAQKQLDPAQIAKLFQKGAEPVEEPQPERLNAAEKKERDNLSVLRGALYAPKR
jgi:hypothetical protein